MYIVERKIAARMQTNADILTATGRQYGPDFILKVDSGIKSPGDPANANGIIASIAELINNKSTISELLNIVAICCNADAGRNNTTLEEGSLPTGSFGLCDVTPGNAGRYNTAAPGAADAAAVNPNHQPASLYANCATPVFDINNLVSLQTAASTGADVYKIHQGLIRRKTDQATAGTYDLNDPISLGDLTAAAPHAPIIGLMSRVFKQSINILEQTRKILGPKGWTSLFASIKGGGGLKKTQKIQHRRHRRRYSSKQY